MDEWKKERIYHQSGFSRWNYTFRNVRGNCDYYFYSDGYRYIYQLDLQQFLVHYNIYFVIHVSNAFVRYQFTSLLIFFYSFSYKYLYIVDDAICNAWLIATFHFYRVYCLHWIYNPSSFIYYSDSSKRLTRFSCCYFLATSEAIYIFFYFL